MLLEKNAELTQHPQAHYINNRTMEVSVPDSVAALNMREL
jgi:hypothetical protein